MHGLPWNKAHSIKHTKRAHTLYCSDSCEPPQTGNYSCKRHLSLGCTLQKEKGGMLFGPFRIALPASFSFRESASIGMVRLITKCDVTGGKWRAFSACWNGESRRPNPYEGLE